MKQLNLTISSEEEKFLKAAFSQCAIPRQTKEQQIVYGLLKKIFSAPKTDIVEIVVPIEKDSKTVSESA
jgi:hypothetical protein